MKSGFRMAVLLILAGCFGREAGAEETKFKSPSPEALVRVAEKLSASLVVVEYTPQYDKGEEPFAGGWLPLADFSGRFLGELVEKERPLSLPGVLISAEEVLTFDPMIHPRFLRALHVRFGSESVPARPAAYAKRDQYACVLRLDRPLKSARPLAFHAEAKGPYFLAIPQRNNMRWTWLLKPFTPDVMVPTNGRAFFLTPPGCLIVNRDGLAVGGNANTHVFLDAPWKGSPRKLWSFLSEEERRAMLETLRRRVEAGLFRVSLAFRSPKKEPDQPEFGETPVTEQQAVGILTTSDTLLVLALLPPRTTARLERIQVHLPGAAEPIEATFVGSLKDYGALLVRTAKAVPGRPIPFSAKEILDYEDRLLPAVEFRIQGDTPVAYYQHRRIGGYVPGWRGRAYPRTHGPENDLFLFDEDGSLLVLPLARRSGARQDQYSQSAPQLTAARDLRAGLASPEKHLDPSNVPLSEAEESRLAWLGVVLQPLDAELARANRVSDLTRNGQTGAMISHVYPGSPAERAGLRAGDILLRLHAEGQPRPVEITALREGRESLFPMLWQRYDEIPEPLFDRIPRPWPPAETPLTRTLTDLGFGKKFAIDYAREGKAARKEFTVEQSPPHYDTAEKYLCRPLGLTVRDLTYEVRQYFRRPEGEPGVIVSKIESGSKASVAGLRPYEIITHVNDHPVRDVKEFELLTQAAGELRLEVKRWTRGRVVKLVREASPEAPASAPATQPAGS